ncbi:DUF4199 domain-containing protein [Marinilabiliaceae bacterium JC017]|nr:DUF4199 domain-containing protein [Marinilabiliaceae bacterium JC017]
MEKQTSSKTKMAMSYGLYLGLALVVYSLILYVSGQTFNKSLGYVSYIIMLLGIGWGMKHYRDNVNNGLLTYGQGMGLGVLISVFAGVISGFFSFILMKYIDPSLMEQALAMAQEEALKGGATEAQLDQMEGVMGMFSNPWVIMISAIIGSAFIGAIISLILAAIFKRTPENSFEEAVKDVE